MHQTAHQGPRPLQDALGRPPGRRPRVALYGHDTCGLGHLRRNLALAAAVRSAPGRPDVLVLTGSPEAQRFERPEGVELVVLPSVRKDADGRYRSGALDVPLADVVALRSATAAGVLAAWEPDLLVVDKAPWGFQQELRGALTRLRAGGRTRTVLGLRDVLDHPDAAAREWRRDGGDDALRAVYDEVWVYGDDRVHDVRTELAPGTPAPALGAPVRFLGYLAQGRRDAGAPPLPRHRPGTRTVLAGVGGGQDGAALTRALLRTALPDGVELVLLPGPFAPDGLRAELDAAAAARDDLHVVAFTGAAADWAAQADAVVCMGGYNTVAEVLATGTPALVVPRTSPRREQEVRARALAAHGHLDVLLAPGPERLSAWVAGALARPRAARTGIALDGLDAVRRRAGELLAGDPLTGDPLTGELPAAPALATVPAALPDLAEVPRAC
ncbi:glycosyltransferase family protein [Kineococcus terrestris]|uniref:glycosyltransferase family protein n=1 Tax=Kineococcus terrestris TaxID=2044856 RepID=UPI0034DB4644